jgi:hypothetical protein
MHPTIIERFPRVGMLYQRSKASAPDNYFGIYDSARLYEGTERQFTTWESLLQALDAASLEVFLRKAAGRVSARSNPDRGWGQLIESVNEVRGYMHARSLGFTTCRLLDEQAHPFPDIEAMGVAGRCLIEVKTIQESDQEIKLRGQLQGAERGLPQRLKRVLRKRYSHAIDQIAGHPWACDAHRICYMIINLDLRTVLAEENKNLLREFIEGLQSEVEINYTSQYWPPDPDET